MMRRQHFLTTAGLAIMALLTGPALAQHAGDVEITVTGGTIATNQRVYGAELGEGGIPNEIDEPGFDAVPGTFAANTPVGFNILDALRVWDGSDFDTVATPDMTISFSSLNATTPGTAGSTQPGFTINANSSGEWHRHLIFMLNSPADTGIYLLQLELFSTDSNYGTSLPFYIVFNQNDDELNHDAAIDYVQSSLVPEPATLILASLGGGMMTLARRRRGNG